MTPLLAFTLGIALTPLVDILVAQYYDRRNAKLPTTFRNLVSYQVGFSDGSFRVFDADVDTTIPPGGELDVEELRRFLLVHAINTSPLNRLPVSVVILNLSPLD